MVGGIGGGVAQAYATMGELLTIRSETVLRSMNVPCTISPSTFLPINRHAALKYTSILGRLDTLIHLALLHPLHPRLDVLDAIS